MVYYMTIRNSILPGSSADVDNIIVNLCDGYTLVTWSGVNKKTYSVLSNEFFERRFATLYPLFRELKIGVCPTLQACHPANCWKVISCFASDPDNDNPHGHAMTLKVYFQEKGVQIYRASLELSKSKKEAELKEICGSGDEDPHASVNRAQGACAKASEEIYNFERLVMARVSEAEMFLPQVGVDDRQQALRIMDWLKNHRSTAELFVSYSDEEIINMTDEELELEGVKGIDKSLISAYRSLDNVVMPIICVMPSFSEKKLERDRLCDDHTNLINRGEILRFEISALDSKIHATNDAYVCEVQDECRKMNMHIHFTVCIPILEECQALIQKEFSEARPPGHLRNQICDLINSLPKQVKTRIWQSLYDKCANGVIEDQWSEMHCHEFLPQLEGLVNDTLEVMNFQLRSISHAQD